MSVCGTRTQEECRFPSDTDYSAMANLLTSEEFEAKRFLMTLSGLTHRGPSFRGRSLSEPITNSSPPPKRPFIGLALSRRGLTGDGIPPRMFAGAPRQRSPGKVKVLSTVSGGSVIGACYAYSPDDFATFDRKIVGLLQTGIQRMIVKELLTSAQWVKILLTLVVSGLPTASLWCFRQS